MHHTRTLLLFLALCLLGGVPAARAAYIINVNQVGSDVVATGSGSIDLADLTFQSSGSSAAQAIPAAADVVVGSGGGNNSYSGATGPTSFGPGSFTPLSSSSGRIVGTVFATLVATGLTTTFIYTPFDYVSGTDLGVSTAAFNNHTISSMGFTPGIYVETWGSGPHADSFTVNVHAVPEPASLSLLALAGTMLLRRRRTMSPKI